MKNLRIFYGRALNPMEKKSGIKYCSDDHHEDDDWIYNYGLRPPCQGIEMIDDTVTESISLAYHSNLSFFKGVRATYDIIVGRHYEPPIQEEEEILLSERSSKGVLDYLILPLCARVMMHVYIQAKQKEERCSMVLLIAAPLVLATELFRFSAGIALTFLLLPIIGLIHTIRACASMMETATSKLPAPCN